MSGAGPGGLEEDEPRHLPRVGLAVVVAVAICLGVALLGLPREGAAIPTIARQALVVAVPHWRTTEPVSEVVYGTRGIDTFGETFLLLAAVSSVLLFCRHREGRRGFIGETSAGEKEQGESDPRTGHDPAMQMALDAERAEWDVERPRRRPTPDREPLGDPAPDTAEAMSVLVRGVVRAITPALAIAGLYLVAQNYSPGGGFPAGAVVAGVVLLVYAGLGYRQVHRAVRTDLVEVIELLGAFALVAIEALGLILAGSFSANWIHLAKQQTLRSGGILQAFSITEFVEVGAGLVIVLFALMTMRHDWSPDSGSS
jgi:multicomponent Na+:H+ antiporter subunit B